MIISGTAPSTQEIPQAVAPDNSAVAPNPETQPIPPPASANGQQPQSEIAKYEQSQNPEQDPKVGTLREFMAEGDETSSIGVEVRETHRKLKSGEEADGLLVMQVFSGSPAEQAGLKPLKRTTHNVLSGAAIAAAMIFPPAIMVLPILDYAQVGESYDMIIGVDGSRVTNFLDFEERMRTAQPGQIVYLSVVRNGVRTQLPVTMPQATTTVAK
ncbi:MAG TPA: PDZ domain-containing protein [Candidatus Binataceae bacterium]|nr:PDZ domain-containing protein [Candidatus Binataceae bacterium]